MKTEMKTILVIASLFAVATFGLILIDESEGTAVEDMTLVEVVKATDDENKEITYRIYEADDGKIWIRLELGKYFTVNQLVEIELRGMGDMLITRTIGEFMGDVAEGKIRNASKNNIFDGY